MTSLSDLPVNRRVNIHDATAPSPLFAGSSHRPTTQPREVTKSPTDERSPTISPRVVHWPTVYQIRDMVTRQLAKAVSPSASEATRKQQGRSIIPQEIRTFREDETFRGGNTIADRDIDTYAAAVESTIFGYGRWEHLMTHPDYAGWENIEMIGHDVVRMVYSDKVVLADPVADSDDELIDQVRYLATYHPTTPKDFKPGMAGMTLALGEKYRLHAMANLGSAPSIVIRQHNHRQVTLEELAALGMMPPHVAEFLRAAIQAKLSMVVGGAQGSGKTTLTRALGEAIPTAEGVGVIESDPELFLDKLPGRHGFRHWVAQQGSAEALGPRGKPVGEVSLEDLLRESLRQSLSRVIVGECLGPEVAVMFQAMQVGAGSLSTIHAHSALNIIERIAVAAGMGSTGLTIDDAYRQITTNIHLLVFIGTRDNRSTGGTFDRWIEEIRAIEGFTENSLSMPASDAIYRAGSSRMVTNIPAPLMTQLQNTDWGRNNPTAQKAQENPTEGAAGSWGSGTR